MSMPAADRRNQYSETRTTWRGFGLTIRHCARWCSVSGMSHIEVISDDRVPLPITSTGYRSHFVQPEWIAEIGTPLEYVMAWLDHEAQTESWQRQEEATRQLCLF